MLPKNSKAFLQPTAEKLGCDKTLVEDAVGFFYEESRRVLVDMKSPIIQLENLGSFSARKGPITKLIDKYGNHLASLDPNNFSQMRIIKSVEERREKVLKLQTMMMEEAERRKIFIQNKKNGSGK